MNKKLIRLTESDLHRIVKESAYRILDEGWGSNEKGSKEKLKGIFPEFKESEDERIRQWLIDTIQQIPNHSIEWEVINKEDVLAWLEKQR